jgi:uncharacterized membrane protein
MDTKPITAPGPQDIPGARTDAASTGFRKVWLGVRARLLGGLLLVLPILITFWVVYWLYSSLEKYVIDPLALLVLWLLEGRSPNVELPYWFETYLAPLIAIVIAVVLLYCLGFFVRSRLRQAVDWVLLRLPMISIVYSGVRNVFQALDRQRGQQSLQRAVLVAFPHAGMKTVAFVTATCRDAETQKVLLCVFVPTAPMPASGFVMLVPEEEVIALDWGPEQTLQVLISVGLTAPPEVPYYKPTSSSAADSLTAQAISAAPAIRSDTGPSSLA